MATVIDSLVVKLGLDNSGFKKGKDTAKKDLGELKGSADGASKSFDGMSLSAGKFLAILGGAAAIKSFITDITQSNAALARFAENTGLAVSQISALSGATRVAGGGAGDLESALSMLSKAQTDLKLKGDSSIIPFFNYLGMAMTDAAGKAIPATDLITKMNRQMAGMDKQTAFNAGQMFGISPGMMNLIMKSPMEFDRIMSRQKQMGPLTEKQAKESEQLRAAWVGMQTSGEAMSRSIMETVTPALTTVLEGLSSLGDWVSKNKDFVASFFYAVASAVTLYYLPAMTRAAIATTIAIAPFLAIAAAVAAISAAIALAVDDFQAFKRGADSVFNWKPVQKVMRWLGVKDEDKSQQPSKNEKEITKDDIGHDAQSVVAHAQKMGMTKAQAIGLAAQFQAESNFDPKAVGDNGKAVGAMQWHPDRQSEFKKFSGKDIRESNLREQVEFAIYELFEGKEKSAGKAIQGKEDAGEIARILSKLLVRPLDKEGEANKRAGYANAINVGKTAQNYTSGNVAPSATSSTQVTTSIGEVKVYTQATDAVGIAGALGDQIEQSLAYQLNGGMN